MMDNIKGQCACGDVTYDVNGSAEFSFHCHCRKCQRSTGGGHSSAFAVAKEDTTIKGELRYFAQPADTGSTTYSAFCPNCGSPILSKTERFPDRLYFHVATLDDPSKFKPELIVFEEHRLPWDLTDIR